MKGTKAMTQTERTKKHRIRMKAEGWRLVQVYLEPRSTAIVQMLTDEGASTSQAINELIQGSGD
jgi:hypothetical protein